MKTHGINLSWIVVQDIKKAIKFYTEVAGLKLKEYDEKYGWAELSGPEGSTLGIAQESQLNPTKAGSNAVVTISVENMDKAKAHFKGMGATLIGDTMEVPGHVKLQTFVDNDGNTLQLVQNLT